MEEHAVFIIWRRETLECLEGAGEMAFLEAAPILGLERLSQGDRVLIDAAMRSARFRRYRQIRALFKRKMGDGIREVGGGNLDQFIGKSVFLKVCL